MINPGKRFIGCAAMLAMAGCAGMTYAPVNYSNGVMTGENGRTLYTFDKDVAFSGKSVCNGPCATNWPPFIAATSESPGGDWSVVTRDDGAKQWAWSGKPLYYYAKDRQAGDKTGDNFNNAWRVAEQPKTDYTAGNMNGP